LVRHRYDVVHALIPSATVAARITGHRTVFTTIGHPVEALRSGGRNRSVLRTGLRAGHVATALSRSAAAAATEVADREVREMNPGLRTEVFTPASAPPAGPPRLLFAAHAGEQRKRLPLLLDAMPRVLDALPGARLIVGGGGDLPDGVPPRVADAADVVGPGALADLPDRYRLATLTVLPSVDEAFGLVLVESLGCGRPVVGADSGGIPEIVTERVGRLARPDDPRALADAIIETATLAAEPDTVRRCAEHAVRWSWDVVGPAHLAAYQDALR
jgi:glycosyltransferase involved in cell wall biosynthesis